MPTKAQYTEPQVRQLADGRREVLDPVRKRWVALTPEEGVRQWVIGMLHDRYGYPYELMQVEGAITLNGMTRRCDIVVYDTDGAPQMIVECKKPEVAITQKVCDQACRYNTVLHVPYLLLTNGRQAVTVRVDWQNGRLEQMAEPVYFAKKS